jgi:hypothetical protein
VTGLRLAMVLAAAAAVLTGCGGDFPPWSAPEPTDQLAVRETPAGVIEGVLVPCGPVRVSRIEVLMLGMGEDRGLARRAWQVDLVPPADGLLTFDVGGVPSGGVLRVPFRGLADPDPKRGPLLQVVLADGTEWTESLGHSGELSGGRVRFHARTTSAAEFAERSRCP